MHAAATRLTHLALATSLLIACTRETVDPLFIFPTDQERAELVCGDDGETYSVQEADATSVAVVYRGSCEFPMGCEPGDPARACFVGDECTGDSNVCVPGPGTACNCPPSFDPVCGTDARTYSSECDASCSEIDIAHRGYCVPPSRSDCVVSGCAGQYCVEAAAPVISSCEWTDALECYEGANCNRQLDGSCGFTFPSGVEPCEDDLAPPPPSCDVDNPCQAGWTCATALVDPAARVCIPCNCADDDLPVCGTDGQTYRNPCYADCAGTEIAGLGPCER